MATLTPRVRDTLMARFQKRVHRGSFLMKSDDADSLIHTNSEHFHRCIEAMYIFGRYPWDNKPSPTVLAAFPEKDAVSQTLCRFCFPSGCEFSSSRFTSVAGAISAIFDQSFRLSFEPQFYLENSDSPFLFCYKIEVNPLTLPSISHDLTLNELLSHVSIEYFPTTTICIAIRTKFPFSSLFREIVTWILQSDLISRMQASSLIDDYLSTGKPIEQDSVQSFGSILAPETNWPESFRFAFTNNLSSVFTILPPSPDDSVLFDFSPFPPLSWKRPNTSHSYYPLARSCLKDLVKLVTPEIFVRLFSALCLEKSIIVYSRDSSILSEAILSLHYMLRPLRWVSGSVSVLPNDLSDMLYSPSPLLVGIIDEIADRQPQTVYLDLVNKKLHFTERIPKFIKQKPMTDELTEHWESARKGNEQSLQTILQLANISVREMVGPAEASIVSNFSDINNTSSKFVEELFLSHFDEEERPYLEAFCATQMFRAYVEQMCRKRTDNLIGQTVLKEKEA